MSWNLIKWIFLKLLPCAMKNRNRNNEICWNFGKKKKRKKENWKKMKKNMSLSKFLTSNFQFEGRILPTRFARLRVASGDRRREATLTRTSLLFISVNTPWNRRDSNLKIAYLIFTLMICSETLTSVSVSGQWSGVMWSLFCIDNCWKYRETCVGFISYENFSNYRRILSFFHVSVVS